MRQIWIPKIGGPKVLALREAPDPVPTAQELKVRVAASGVNFADILARMGLYPDAPKLPTVVGYEVAGTVDAIGKDVVQGFKVGDRVLALTRFGGYSDVVTVPALQCQTIPDALSFEQAAAIPVNYLTTWLMLIYLSNVRAGDKVLIHAVAGGVGQAALQLCRWRGAVVLGTASASKHQRLKELGVDYCIDYHREDFEAAVAEYTGGRGVDIVLDAVGGRSFAKSYRCLASLGRLYLFGISSLGAGSKRSLPMALKGLLQMPTFKPIPLMNDNRGVMGVNLGHLWHRGALIKEAMGEILSLVGEGRLAPVVDKSFSFAEAAAAHAYIQNRKNFGKVVLVP